MSSHADDVTDENKSVYFFFLIMIFFKFIYLLPAVLLNTVTLHFIASIKQKKKKHFMKFARRNILISMHLNNKSM